MKLACVEGSANERHEAKAWLVELRKAQGWERGDVAEMLGTSIDTVKNWELPSRGFANGLTLMRYLKLLGVLWDEAPGEIPALGRLAKLEATVAESADRTAASLEALTRGIERIEALLSDEGGQARGAQG